MILINKTMYDYYELVTQTIHKYGCDDIKANEK